MRRKPNLFPPKDPRAEIQAACDANNVELLSQRLREYCSQYNVLSTPESTQAFFNFVLQLFKSHSAKYPINTTDTTDITGILLRTWLKCFIKGFKVTENPEDAAAQVIDGRTRTLATCGTEFTEAQTTLLHEAFMQGYEAATGTVAAMTKFAVRGAAAIADASHDEGEDSSDDEDEPRRYVIS